MGEMGRKASDLNPVLRTPNSKLPLPSAFTPAPSPGQYASV
jgi:hypothetical protein